MSDDSTATTTLQGNPDSLGSGRFRRETLSTLAMLRQGKGIPEEPIATKADLPGAPFKHSGYAGMSPEEQLEARDKAKAWMDAFYEKASPVLLSWLKVVGGIDEGDIYPWKSWEAFKASKTPETRAWLMDESGENQERIIFAPMNRF